MPERTNETNAVDETSAVDETTGAPNENTIGIRAVSTTFDSTTIDQTTARRLARDLAAIGESVTALHQRAPAGMQPALVATGGLLQRLLVDLAAHHSLVDPPLDGYPFELRGGCFYLEGTPVRSGDLVEVFTSAYDGVWRAGCVSVELLPADALGVAADDEIESPTFWAACSEFTGNIRGHWRGVWLDPENVRDPLYRAGEAAQFQNFFNRWQRERITEG